MRYGSLTLFGKTLLIVACLAFSSKIAIAQEEGQSKSFYEEQSEILFQMWSGMVHAGVEKVAGFPINSGDFLSKQDALDEAERACIMAEQQLKKGNDKDAALKLNRCRLLSIRMRNTKELVKSMALLGDIHQAQGRLNLALKDYQTTILAAKQFKQKRYELQAMLGIATLHLLYGDFAQAEAAFFELRPEYRELSADAPRELTPDVKSQILFIRIMIALSKPGPKEVVALLLPTLEEQKSKLAPASLLHYWLAKSALSFALEQYADAVGFADKGLTSLKELLPAEPEVTRGMIWKMHLNRIKGLALAANGDASSAMDALEQARESYYIVRADLAGDSKRLKQLTGVMAGALGGLVESLATANRVGDAWRVAADIKNLFLLDEMPSEYIGSDEVARREFAALTRETMTQISKKGGFAAAGTSAALFAGEDAARVRYVTLLTSGPLGQSLLPLATMDLTSEKMLAAIPEDAVVLDYFWHKGLRLFVANRTGVQMVKIDVNEAKLMSQIEILRGALSDPNIPFAAESRDIAKAIHDALINPAQIKLSKAKKMIVSSDGILKALPWPVLYDGNAYIVDRYDITAIQSSVDLITDATSQKPIEPNVVFVSKPGSEGMTGGVSLVSAPNDASRSVASGALGSPIELNLVGGGSLKPQWSKITYLERADPTAENILGYMSTEKDKNLLQIHIPLNVGGSDPLLSKFDGTMTLRDLMFSKYDSLPVLLLTDARVETLKPQDSQCLATALMGAAKQGVVTHWRLSDAQGARLYSEKLFSEMALGLTPAAAHMKGLRALKANIRYSHPHYWAALNWYGGVR